MPQPPTRPRRDLQLDTDTAPHRITDRGRPRDEGLTRRLLVAALTLIDDHGYSALTPEAVTRRAGASKGTFYSRWSTCEQLTVEALELHPPVDPVLHTGSVRGDLLDLMHPWTRAVDRDERVCGHLLGPARHSPALRAALDQAVVSPLTRAVGTVVLRAAQRGQAVPLTGTRLLTRMVVAMWWERSLACPDPWSPGDLAQVVDHALLPIVEAPQSPPGP